MDCTAYTHDPEEYERLVKELYDQYPEITLSPEYASFIENNLLMLLIRLARYKFAARQLRPTDTVLEIGSGSGLGALFLGQFCQSVTGLEVKEHERTEAEKINRRKNVQFESTDFFEYPESKLYDVIVSLDVIEHLTQEQGQAFIQKTANHLRPDGMCIIGTPSVYCAEYQSAFSKAGHITLYDLPELIDLLQQHYGRVLRFSMNDEMVHTGFHKMAWYYMVIGTVPHA